MNDEQKKIIETLEWLKKVSYDEKSHCYVIVPKNLTLLKEKLLKIAGLHSHLKEKQK